MLRHILYISSVHFQYDSRIVYRICTSLAKKYQVTLLIPEADASVSADFQTISIPFFRKLWQRLLFVHPLILWKSLFVKADIICFPDPELIPLAFIFKFLGKKIIFDVHENTHKQLKTKSFNNASIFQNAFKWFDFQARKYIHLILAETAYLQEYNNLAHPSEVILNYPSLRFFEKINHLTATAAAPTEYPNHLFYIGQISYARCIDVKINATAILLQDFPDFKIDLFGNSEFDLFDLDSLNAIPAYFKVKTQLHFYGKTDPKIAFQYAKNAFAGIALLKPTADFMDSYPTKLFEYMALGLPVITSNFPLYKAVVEMHNCGICINPTDTQALVNAIKHLLNNPEEANRLGANGKKAIQEHYNWESQEERLWQFFG